MKMTIFFLSKRGKKEKKETNKKQKHHHGQFYIFPSWELTEEINLTDANTPLISVYKEKERKTPQSFLKAGPTHLAVVPK